MDVLEVMLAFYRRASADNRISPSHISLFFALLHELSNTDTQVLLLKRNDVMDKAKLSSRGTYNKRLQELHKYGYIVYVPSNTPGKSVMMLGELS